MTTRRTQAQRSAATQDALRAAARELWGGERGYADVGTPEIAQRAGVTRGGAMYHQYADKSALFLDVVEAVEADVMNRLAAAVLTEQPPTPLRPPCTRRWMPGSTSAPSARSVS